MVHIGTDCGDRAVSGPGLVAAAMWALGLVIGLGALATGHQNFAGVSLVLAVMAPWFGLVWVARSQRGLGSSRARDF